jgi:glutathione reductase (NADPH)
MTDAFDLVVVGTGNGGSATATRCRAAGWRVAIVDELPYGGTCSLRGCDPKRVLVGAAELADWQRRMTGSGIEGDARIDWPELTRFKRTFTDPVPATREAAFEKAGISTYHGTARFAEDDRMLVTADDGEVREIQARHFMLASGAAPRQLRIPGEEHVCTSTDFLELCTLPARIAFIGAGYISFEFAHLAQRAGAQAIVLGRGTPLARFDQDVVQRLVAHSRTVGIDLRTDTDVIGVEQRGMEYRVQVETERGAEHVDADLVVHGAGRVPDTGHLDLARGNIATDERGAIIVNQFLQSSTNPRVYAAGDCVLPPGKLPLTPVAVHEGIIAASNLLHGNAKKPDYRGTPSVVFTVPPLAMVGLTEAAARAQGLQLRVKSKDSASWFSNRRVREPAAMFKTIVDESTGQILGAHLLGPNATDVINIFALAIRSGLRDRDLRFMIYAYPTSTSDVSDMI